MCIDVNTALSCGSVCTWGQSETPPRIQIVYRRNSLSKDAIWKSRLRPRPFFNRIMETVATILLVVRPVGKRRGMETAPTMVLGVRPVFGGAFAFPPVPCAFAPWRLCVPCCPLRLCLLLLASCLLPSLDPRGKRGWAGWHNAASRCGAWPRSRAPGARRRRNPPRQSSRRRRPPACRPRHA